MEAKFTPGPWDCTGCMFPDDDMGGVYYRVQADGIDARAANARLIAASPIMYEFVAQKAVEGDAAAAHILEAIHASRQAPAPGEGGEGA